MNRTSVPLLPPDRYAVEACGLGYSLREAEFTLNGFRNLGKRMEMNSP